MKNIKLAFRYLKKDKINTAINIVGLSIGLSIVSIVAVFLINELSYNSSIKKSDRIYRVLNYDSDTKKTWATTPYPLGEYAKGQITNIENYTQHSGRINVEIKKDNNYFEGNSLICTNSNFFDMFNIKILNGSVKPEFDKLENQILICKTMAYRYFGKQDVVGETLIINIKNKDKPMQIVGVYDDIPNNSTIKAQLIGNLRLHYEINKITSITVGNIDLDTWYHSWKASVSLATYFLIKDHSNVKAIEKQIADIGKENALENTELNFSLQALNDVYFNSQDILDNTNVDKGNLNMLYILSIVGFLILLIASVNYLNLSFAQSVMRIKNLSVNRIFGATRIDLVKQIISESIIIVLLSLPIAIVGAYYLTPYANQFFAHNYLLSLSSNTVLVLLVITSLTIFMGIISGLTVALKSTSFNVVETMKGKNILSGEKFITRKVSIIFQFVVFIILLVVVLGVQKQVHHVMNADMGFKKEGLIKITKGDKNYEIFKQEVLKNPNIISVSAALWLPPSNNNLDLTFKPKDKNKKSIAFRGNLSGYNFAQTMGFKILSGEDFQENKHKSGVLLSKTAAKLLEDKDIIGKDVGFGKVIGVIDDFNMSSLHSKANPMLIILQPASCGDIAVRVKTKNITETLSFLEQEYNKIEGSTEFMYQFTDDILAEMYASDKLFSQLIGLLAFIAVFIASLGLFGLSLLMSKQKTKEIGIRKINGATITEILTMLNKGFVKWIIIAFVIATPIAYYAMSLWLENFAYKTTLSWWIFALAGISATAIALLTVSWQSWKAASRNPVEALRYE